MKQTDMARTVLMTIALAAMLGCEPIGMADGGERGLQSLVTEPTPIPTLVPLNISGMEQTDTPLSSAPAIRESDFVLPLKKGRFDLLHMGAADLERMTGRTFVYTQSARGTSGRLETDEAVFLIWSDRPDTYIHAVTFKALHTARGVTVGSPWQAALAAYPEPYTVTQEGRAYLFAAPIPEDIEDKEFGETRPLCFYGVEVTMDDPGERVREVKIVNRLIE